LQSGRLLVDRAGNKIMAVSFWDSQEDEASLQSSELSHNIDFPFSCVIIT